MTTQPFDDLKAQHEDEAPPTPEAARRLLNTMLHFWRACALARCRRNHACAGDPYVCFRAIWPAMPEEEKEYVRGCITAAQTTRSAQEIGRAGDAARDACLQRQQAAAPPVAATRDAPPQPAIQRAPELRLRRL